MSYNTKKHDRGQYTSEAILEPNTPDEKRRLVSADTPKNNNKNKVEDIGSASTSNVNDFPQRSSF